MRITGGCHCGRRLRVPSGMDVRPTQDRVRESVFGSLAARLAGARFLDLYAGSGAVGLEALSRGASEVVWVESNRRIYQTLIRNVAEVAGVDAGTAVMADVRRYVSRPARCPYDAVYADPPYGDTGLESLIESLMRGGWLATGGVLLIETAETNDVQSANGLVLIGEKRYGRTKVIWLRPE